MSNFQFKDANGDIKYSKSSGAGSDGDPFVPDRTDTTLSTKVGEVQASPTANTVLGRLKDLLTGIVLSAGTALIGKVGIDQSTANANEVVVKSGTTAVTNAGLTALNGAIAGTEVQVDIVSMPATSTIANGADVAQGTTTDAAASSSAAEDGTARTGIGLWKAIKNILVLINAKLVSGTDIGDVTINNSTGGSAVNIQDGGNTITVDGTVSAISATAANLKAEVTIASSQTIGLSAGDNNIGNVDIVTMPTVTTKGTAKSVTATLTVTNGAYAVADVVGGLITFANVVSANGKSCVLNSLTLAGVAAIPYELWFFSADIATPRVDNAVFGLAAADGGICLGIVPIDAADYKVAQTSFSNACVRGIGLQMQAGAGTTSLYAYLKATAITSPGTTTLYLTANFEYVD